MSDSAHVQSLEAIEAVRRAVQSFDEQVADALTELGAEMRRMQDWLGHDRPRHWKMQTRKAMDQVHEAQQALHRCLMFPIADERPSCYEERMELKKAQTRLAYCQEKESRVRHWQRSVQHELFEYEGRISQLVRLVEVDMPQAAGVLTKIIRRLEDYQSLRAGNSRASYNDVSFAKELFSEHPDGEAASAPKEGAEDLASADEPSAAPGIEREASHDAQV
jgi:exonuclease VII large subunit